MYNHVVFTISAKCSGCVVYSYGVSLSSQGDFTAIVDLVEGRHEYKFFVDGQWVHDHNEVSYPFNHRPYTL